MENRVKIHLEGITNSQEQQNAFALVLAEDNGSLKIPIIINMSVAQSIAIAIEHVDPPRPLTHDLFVGTMEKFDLILKEIFIYKYEDGVYFSELLISDGKEEKRQDSRTSDAIALAVRVGCPMYIDRNVLNECGMHMERLRKRTDSDEKDIVKMNLDETEIGAEMEEDKMEASSSESKEKKMIAKSLHNFKKNGPSKMSEDERMFVLKYLDDDVIKRYYERSIQMEDYENAKYYKEEMNRRKI